MADAAQIKAIVEQYTTLHSARETDRLAALFADDAVAYDPVDAAPHVGRDAIRAFFAGTHDNVDGFTLELTGPVRVAANFAAFPMMVTTVMGDTTMQLDIIDVFTFDDDAKITEMKAYWSMEDARFS